MGFFDSNSDSSRHESEQTTRENNEGQADGAKADVFGELFHSCIGGLIRGSDYSKGFENGLRNPSKPEKSSSQDRSSTSTSTESSWSASGSDYSTSNSSTSSLGGCAVLGGVVIGAVVLIANLFSDTGVTPSRPQLQLIPSPPAQQIASPKPQQSISEKQQDFLSPQPQHGSSPIRVRGLGMKKALSLEEAHVEIGQVYQSAMGSLTPAQQTTLRNEQREWIKWRDAQADRLARTFPAGPNSYSVDHEKAMITLLGERTRYLEDYKQAQQSISEKQQDFLSPQPQHGSSPIRVRGLGMKKALSLEEAHAEIGQVYQSAMRSLTPAQQITLRDEQRGWIKWRDAQADRLAQTFRSGPNTYSVDHEKAMISLLAERIRYLEDYLRNDRPVLGLSSRAEPKAVPPPGNPGPRQKRDADSFRDSVKKFSNF